jgi:hypothetical protein
VRLPRRSCSRRDKPLRRARGPRQREGVPSAVVYGRNTHLHLMAECFNCQLDHWRLCWIVGYVAHAWLEVMMERKGANVTTSPLGFLLHRLNNSLESPSAQASRQPSIAEHLMEDVRNFTRMQHISRTMEVAWMTRVTRCSRMCGTHIKAPFRRTPVYATRRPRSVRVQPRERISTFPWIQHCHLDLQCMHVP